MIVILVLLALGAGSSDLALWEYIKDHYAHHGHFSVPLDLGGLSVGLTGLLIYGLVLTVRTFRKTKDSNSTAVHSRERSR